jgi:hypothetical protein
MRKLFSSALLASVLVAATSASAVAGDLKLSFANGRVTLIAQDVPVRQILSEWARVGQTQFVNAEKMLGPTLTLQLVNVPEKQALDIVLHTASGYMAAPRPVGTTGASLYDRVMILATSRPPTQSASITPPPFTRPPLPQPPPQLADDDAGEPGEQGVVPPPGMVQPGVMPPNTANAPGMQPPPYPGPMPQTGTVQQVPMTAPRPGMLPTPPTGTPGNPYQPYPQPPVVRRPGGGQ